MHYEKEQGLLLFFNRLNANAKSDGWVKCGLKLEVDFSDENLLWEYDKCNFENSKRNFENPIFE